MTAPTIPIIKTRIEALLSLYDGMGSIITKDRPELQDLPAARVRALGFSMSKPVNRRFEIALTFGVYVYIDDLPRTDGLWDVIDALEATTEASVPIAAHMSQYPTLQLSSTEPGIVNSVGTITVSEAGETLYMARRYMAFWMYLPVTVYGGT